jgi:hypothetical protein
VPLNRGLSGPQNPPLSSPYLLHSLHSSDCTQIITLISDCDFGPTKKRKCICFVPDTVTVTVPAPHGCCVIALQIVMNYTFVLKVFKGE